MQLKRMESKDTKSSWSPLINVFRCRGIGLTLGLAFCNLLTPRTANDLVSC